jgi:hypothetical protein
LVNDLVEKTLYFLEDELALGAITMTLRWSELSFVNSKL